MKLDKSIRALPWAEAKLNERQAYGVTVRLKDAGGERLLVVDFIHDNGQRRRRACDLRLVCSKKQKDFAVIFRDRSGLKRKPLSDALSEACSENPTFAYPEITPTDEKKLKSWLRVLSVSGNHYLPELNEWTKEADDHQREAARKARGEIDDEDVNLCPEELPEGLEEYIRETVLPEDNVLLYKKGNRRGLCYHCGEKVNGHFTQFAYVSCPNCGKKMRCLLEGSDHFGVDYVENIITLQKGKDGKTLFLREWHLTRDLTAKWENIGSFLYEVARWAMRGRKVAKWQHEAKEHYYMTAYRYKLDDWERVRNVHEAYDGTYYFFLPKYWRQAVADTALKYCSIQEYISSCEKEKGRANPVRFLADWCRFPAVEKLWKAGYQTLVEEKVSGRLNKKDLYAVRWQRDSIRDAIRFPQRLLKMKKPQQWSHWHMQHMNECWELVERGAIKEAEACQLFSENLNIKLIDAAIGHASIGKIIRYAKGARINLNTYRDYLEDCGKLALNLDDQAVLFPQDLHAAHARTISMIRYEETKELQEQFDKQVKRLEKLTFSYGDLLIRPARTAAELILEGECLHHCVGGYAERMAKGETAIFFVRRHGQESVPFYTLELCGGRVIQCRTEHNESYEKNYEINMFVNLWMEKVVEKKKARKTA